jgi:hypothetical protein
MYEYMIEIFKLFIVELQTYYDTLATDDEKATILMIIAQVIKHKQTDIKKAQPDLTFRLSLYNTHLENYFQHKLKIKEPLSLNILKLFIDQITSEKLFTQEKISELEKQVANFDKPEKQNRHRLLEFHKIYVAVYKNIEGFAEGEKREKIAALQRINDIIDKKSAQLYRASVMNPIYADKTDAVYSILDNVFAKIQENHRLYNPYDIYDENGVLYADSNSENHKWKSECISNEEYTEKYGTYVDIGNIS